MSPRFHALTELAVMDLDTLDLKNCCSEFDIDGDCCSCCKSALPVDGFRHMLEQNQGYLNSDLAALKKKKREGRLFALQYLAASKAVVCIIDPSERGL